MGSLLSGVLESMAGYGRPDAGEMRHRRRDRPGSDQGGQGLRQPVPARVAAEQEGSGGHGVSESTRSTDDPTALRRRSSSISRRASPAPTAPSSWPTAAPRSSRSSHPDGDPLRRWSASGAEIPDGGDGALFSVPVVVEAERGRRPGRRRRPRPPSHALLGRGRRRGVVAGIAPGRAPGTRPGGASGAAPRTSRSPRSPRSAWRDRGATAPATEFTLQAWSGGIVGLGRGAPDRAPVFVGGQVGEWLTGVYAAIGTLVSRRAGRARRRRASSSTCRCSRCWPCASPTTR